jgi:hypothetical protein
VARERHEQSRAPSTQQSGVPGDELLLRVFTLADHAATPPDGKLYISGGGVDRQTVQEVPGQLGQLWLAIRIRVPWHMTSETLHLLLRVLDADRNPVGPDPIVEAQFEVGRPPGVRPGDELGVNLAFGVAGFPVRREEAIFFHLSVADRELGVLPLKVTRSATPPAMPGPRQ